jgi:X-Pro dipeptidyl-peptidase
MNGALSTGCPLHGGPGDVATMKAVIDWLNGCEPGYDNDGNPVTAPWHNGNAAMIGKSYDGTPANGLAATGVDGLTTIRRGGRLGAIRRQVMTLAR